MNFWWARNGVAAATALVVVLFFALVYLPSNREIDALEREVGGLRVERTGLQHRLRDREPLFAARDRARSALDLVERRVPRSSALAQKELAEAAAAAATEVASIEAGAPQRFGNLITRDFALDAVGAFSQILELLGRLEALGDHVALRSLRLEPDVAGGGAIRLKVVIAWLHFASPEDLAPARAGRARGR